VIKGTKPVKPIFWVAAFVFFSALILLVGLQEEHATRKKTFVTYLRE